MAAPIKGIIEGSEADVGAWVAITKGNRSILIKSIDLADLLGFWFVPTYIANDLLLPEASIDPEKLNLFDVITKAGDVGVLPV